MIDTVPCMANARTRYWFMRKTLYNIHRDIFDFSCLHSWQTQNSMHLLQARVSGRDRGPINKNNVSSHILFTDIEEHDTAENYGRTTPPEILGHLLQISSCSSSTFHDIKLNSIFSFPCWRINEFFLLISSFIVFISFVDRKYANRKWVCCLF